MRKSLVVALAITLVAGCAQKTADRPSGKVAAKPVAEKEVVEQKPTISTAKQWRGFNALQTSKVAWHQSGARESLLNMISIGANAVIFVPFMEQPSQDSVAISRASHVTDQQLKAAIQLAHQLGLRVIVKPQVIVRGSWAGGIKFSDSKKLSQWFENYAGEIIRYAEIAEAERVEAFVIGTELKGVSRESHWPGLIERLRKVYHGKLTYSAHGVDDVESFPYWHLLDMISLTLYPSLGDTDDYLKMVVHVEYALYKLRKAVERHVGKPVWLTEIGMPSAEGFAERPWAWVALNNPRVHPDVMLQTKATAIWLDQVRRAEWIDGVFFWLWYSDPAAGGLQDRDYTVQNKPAEIIIRQQWGRD